MKWYIGSNKCKISSMKSNLYVRVYCYRYLKDNEVAPRLLNLLIKEFTVREIF